MLVVSPDIHSQVEVTRKCLESFAFMSLGANNPGIVYIGISIEDLTPSRVRVFSGEGRGVHGSAVFGPCFAEDG